MALITCSECGKEISDKANVCVHCGCPIKSIDRDISNQYVCEIAGEKFDLQSSYKIIGRGKYKEGYLDLHKVIGNKMSMGNLYNLMEYIKFYDEIPVRYEVREYSRDEEKEFVKEMMLMKNEVLSKNPIECPKCGSTQIQAVPRKWSLVTGLLTNKVDRVCLNCKYKF